LKRKLQDVRGRFPSSAPSIEKQAVFKFEENPASGAKDPLIFGAFAAPFDFAQGRLEVVPFHDGFKLRHY